MTTTATLHYIYDPLCGWCYAAAPLVQAAQAVPGLALALHAGGMMVGAQRQPVTPALRNYVMPHDRRIHALTGQPFGDAYFNGLLCDPHAVFDSEPPITAILATAALSAELWDELWDELSADAPQDLALAMLKRIQHAHYVEGRQIARPEVLAALAAELGMAPEAFGAAYSAAAGAPAARHIEQSRRLLGALGGRGFPTFALETDGGYRVLDFGPYLGKAAEWQASIAQQLPANTNDAGRASPVCGPDGCVL
ncbi:DsbA family protein [Cupriavidus sp. WKF15]|uniref:DsbA family protein n=1 Tax=Cupriavidus sp. WKF15 TaxID=3032282 RepID=UPI0023E32282|nr:DsbA family protein [Cupriavidus sp. WKF15]WER46685.1 DsbA family protein [Cupriavidus sp. WKF15]